MKFQSKYQPATKEIPTNAPADCWSPSPDLRESQKGQEGAESKKPAFAEGTTEAAALWETHKKLQEEWQDQLQRKQAELDNLRKRCEREKQEIAAWARAEVLSELLPVADACERALAGLYTTEAGGPLAGAFRSGLDLIGRKLADGLAKFKVTALSSLGQTFNPYLHEALMREETDQYPDQQIIAEFQKGYQIDGRLLRPAQVKVAVHPKQENR